MAEFYNINAKPPLHNFLEPACIGRHCFSPATPMDWPVCCQYRRMYSCPDPLPESSANRKNTMRLEGWRLQK